MKILLHITFIALLWPITPAPGADLLPACELAVQSCHALMDAQDEQIKSLEEQIEVWKKEAGQGHNTPVTLYTALGGAVGGFAMGEVGGSARGGLVGAGVGAISGLLLGLAIQSLGW